MSENKKENLFAKLAIQNVAAAQQDLQPTTPEPAAEAPPSPVPPARKPEPVVQKQKAKAKLGRRADPNYCQANAYVLKTVRRDVERALLDMDGLDYSELVEDLLTRWLKSKRVSG